MVISRRATYGIGTRPRKSPNLDTSDGLDRWRVGLWPAAKGAGNGRPPWLPSDHDSEAELERPVCRQVVAGPRSEPTTHQGARERGRRLPWWPAPSLIGRRSERPAVPGLQVPPSETDASGARASRRELDGADRGAGSGPT